LIANQRASIDEITVIQLIEDELIPLTLRRFPHTTINKDEIIERLRKGLTYVWKDLLGHIVGFVHLIINNQILWVDMIAVHRLKQGKGIGNKLIQHAISYGKSNMMKRVSLYVDDSNHKAIRLYQTLGFRSIQYQPLIYCYEMSRDL